MNGDVIHRNETLKRLISSDWLDSTPSFPPDSLLISQTDAPESHEAFDIFSFDLTRPLPSPFSSAFVTPTVQSEALLIILHPSMEESPVFPPATRALAARLCMK